MRLLSGLDGEKMAGVTAAYEAKYDKPLRSALKDEISGNFLRAAQVAHATCAMYRERWAYSGASFDRRRG